ncbi:MAG: c-type cytochrome [Bacteroidetes bacterium]|nr:c-type cytochrome [Fibrella sp.]
MLYQLATGLLLTAALLPTLGRAQATAGKPLYTTYCTPCHGQKGEGIVGPNLTDAYWLHGNTKAAVVTVLNNGILDKGMAAWKGTLTPKQIDNLALYVLSLSAKPVAGKAAQGKLYATATAGKGKPVKPATESVAAPAVVNPYATPKTPDVAVASADTTPAPAAAPAGGDAVAMLGDADSGKRLFNAVLGCAHCHGTNSVGQSDNRNLREIRKRNGAAWEQVYTKVIQEGRTGTAMPPWNFLTAKQKADVKAFILSIQEE